MLKPILTDVEEEIYRYIMRYILRCGYAPSETEISEQNEKYGSRRKVRRAIKSLVDANYLRQIPGKRRNLELVEGQLPIRELPIIYHIPAGPPFEPLATDKVLDLSELLLGTNRYVLQVIGNSMSGDSICHGDFILCEQRDSATDGEIVVAQLNGTQTTLKRYQLNENGTIALLSSNPDAESMEFPQEEVKILGVYLGLIRLINYEESTEPTL